MADPEKCQGKAAADRLPAAIQATLTAVADDAFGQLRKQARDPVFRSSLDAPNVYIHFEALDAFAHAADSLEVGWQPTLEPLPDTEEAPDSLQHGELSLVDSAELEVDLAITGHARRAEETHREPRLHLELRLEELLLASGKRIDPENAGPRSLLEAFRRTIALLDIETEGKLILLDLYAQALDRRLGVLYDDLNTRLRSAGLLETETDLREAIRARESAAADSQRAAEPGPHAPDTPANEQAKTELHDPGSTPHSTRGQVCPGTAPVGGGTHRVEPSDVSLLETLTGHLYPVSSGAQTTGNSSDRAGVPAFRPAAPAVVHALTVVQQNVTGEDALLDSASVIDAIQSQMHRTAVFTNDGAPRESEITESEARIIDFVNQIFQTVFDDEALTDSVKALLSRLQIPIIKLALMDFDFFQHPGHPARILLNRLVTLSAPIENRDAPLFTRLKNLVDTIVNDFSMDVAPFVDALNRLNRIDYTEQCRARAKEEAARADARRRSRRFAARRAVISTVNRYLHHDVLPDEAMKFILKCWAPYMGMIHLQDGTDSTRWKQAVYALRQIIEAARPERSLSEVEELIGPAEQFFAQITKQLAESSLVQEPQQGVIASTRAWFRKLVDDLAEQQPTPEGMDNGDRPRVRKALLEEPEAADSEPDRLPDLLESIPAEVKPGTWFEIDRGPPQGRCRVRLSAILEDTGEVLFADRTGCGVLELDLETFLRELREGRNRLIDDNNRFDHALSAVIHSICENQDRLRQPA